MRIKADLANTRIDENMIAERREAAQEELGKLWSEELDFTGWVRQPHRFTDEMIDGLKKTAEEIRGMCDIFLVLGVGGSFMGAKAVIDLLADDTDGTKVIFAGYNFSGRYIREIMKMMEGKDVCICVISKSGSTTETLSAYGIFRQMMLDRYGEKETARRTFVVTERRSNYLFDQATAQGSQVFDLALDIGGRYSVLTPVGLLPIAVAGIDIAELVHGARGIASEEAFKGDVLDYAIIRQLFYESGKSVEVFEFFDPYAAYFGEWLKQLFGESEGKDAKGLFPASLMFSRDLHSMGQFLQQGSECFFETFITADRAAVDVDIPESAKDPFAGKTIEQINSCAKKGVMAAHIKAGIPVVSITVPEVNAGTVGELIYFFETECAVSALLSGVDPFDQPGVEAYKREMRDYISRLGD
jgi:glucose-6-phosphate isomerase